MSLIERSNGKRLDWPQLETIAYPALAAGSATDPAQDTVICAVPDLTKRSIPGTVALSPRALNSMRLAEALFVSQAAANTVGNATNYADLRVNVWRSGVLQGCLAYYSLKINTTIGTAVTSGQVNTAVAVTPAAMTGIVAGMALGVGAGGTFEVVYVASTTATTYTATYLFAHANTDAVTSIFVPYQPVALTLATLANTTSGGAVTAGAGRTLTPASMYGIHVGDLLLCDTVGSGIQETVTVTAVTATTFTATFANTHGSTFILVSTGATQGAGNNSYLVTQNTPFVLRPFDVLTVNRISNNVTGIATPAGLVELEWVPSEAQG